jgi:hypothetical protein
LYENGKCDEADKEKERLENKQREARKVLESQGGAYSPKWFEQKGDGDSAYWSYKGGYFEKRGQFGEDLPQLW